MKFTIQVVVCILLCLLLQLFLPWWTITFGAAVAGFAGKNKALISFIACFTGVAILWFGLALYSDLATSGILTRKINALLPVHPLLLTTLIGGLLGGMSGLTGAIAAKL